MMRLKRVAGMMFLAGMTCMFSCVLTGCGKKKNVEIPVMRSEQLQAIFFALEDHDYDMAMSKTETYMAMNPKNTFLPEFKSVIVANKQIYEAEQAMSQGKSEEALKILRDAKVKVGDDAQIVNAYTQLKQFCQIRDLVLSLKNPVSSVRMEKEAKQLIALTSNKKEYANINKYAIQRSREVSTFAQMEKEGLSFLLYSEMMNSWEEKNFPMFHLYAVSLHVNAQKSREWQDIVRRNYFETGNSEIKTND